MTNEMTIEDLRDWKVLFGALAAKVSGAANSGSNEVRNVLLREAMELIDNVYNSPIMVLKSDLRQMLDGFDEERNLR